MKNTVLRTLALVLVGAAMMVGIHATPASADPNFNQLSTNTLSPQYMVNGCRYKARYGNIGASAYAQMRIYNPASCTPASVALNYHDGTSEQSISKSFASGYTTGSDGCGAYREVQVTAPVVAFATAVVTSVPPPAGDPFGGLRAYSSDGTRSQPIHSTC